MRKWIVIKYNTVPHLYAVLLLFVHEKFYGVAVIKNTQNSINTVLSEGTSKKRVKPDKMDLNLNIKVTVIK